MSKLKKTVKMFQDEGDGRPPRPPSINRDSEATVVGSAPAGWGEPEITDHELDEPKEPEKPAEPPRAEPAERPLIEVEVRKVKNLATHARRPPPAYEVWTKNRVYNLDTSLICTEVIELSSGRTDEGHQLIGARLVGGQRRRDEGNELSYPLPVPGTDAVFQRKDAKGRVRLVMTSKVTRVILHVQRVVVVADNSEHTWDQITSSRHISDIIRG
ncbi:MAG: hypothetical protein R3B13_33260 [Polyangiaceae bacterium]